MTYRRYLWTITLSAVLGWTSFILVLYKFEPCTAAGELTLCHSVSALSLFLFFVSLFFALTGTCAMLGFGMRYWFHRQDLYLDHLTVSLRQGLLLTLCIMGSLVLLLLNALTWWSGLLLIAIIILVEFYFTPSAQ